MQILTLEQLKQLKPSTSEGELQIMWDSFVTHPEMEKVFVELMEEVKLGQEENLQLYSHFFDIDQSRIDEKLQTFYTELVDELSAGFELLEVYDRYLTVKNLTKVD
jgi:hypothetical protein